MLLSVLEMPSQLGISAYVALGTTRNEVWIAHSLGKHAHQFHQVTT